MINEQERKQTTAAIIGKTAIILLLLIAWNLSGIIVKRTRMSQISQYQIQSSRTQLRE